MRHPKLTPRTQALLVLAAVVATIAVAVIVPGASANHHACPQVSTSQSGNVNVARKDCSPVYVPYPVGGPKSPLPSGASFNLPPVKANCTRYKVLNGKVVCPKGQLLNLPTIVTPYPPFKPLPGQGSPSDPLGCYGPDLSGPTKAYLQPILGKPTGGDPPDPYNCSGGWIMSAQLASTLLAAQPTGKLPKAKVITVPGRVVTRTLGGVTKTIAGSTTTRLGATTTLPGVTQTLSITRTLTGPITTLTKTVTLPTATITVPSITTTTVTIPGLSGR